MILATDDLCIVIFQKINESGIQTYNIECADKALKHAMHSSIFHYKMFGVCLISNVFSLVNALSLHLPSVNTFNYRK